MRLAKQQDAKTKQIIRRGREAFRWQIPERYNMGVDVCDKFANITPNAPALIDILGDGSPRPYSYLELKRLSNRLANSGATTIVTDRENIPKINIIKGV